MSSREEEIAGEHCKAAVCMALKEKGRFKMITSIK